MIEAMIHPQRVDPDARRRTAEAPSAIWRPWRSPSRCGLASRRRDPGQAAPSPSADGSVLEDAGGRGIVGASATPAMVNALIEARPTAESSAASHATRVAIAGRDRPERRGPGDARTARTRAEDPRPREPLQTPSTSTPLGHAQLPGPSARVSAGPTRLIRPTCEPERPSNGRPRPTRTASCSPATCRSLAYLGSLQLKHPEYGDWKDSYRRAIAIPPVETSRRPPRLGRIPAGSREQPAHDGVAARPGRGLRRGEACDPSEGPARERIADSGHLPNISPLPDQPRQMLPRPPPPTDASSLANFQTNADLLRKGAPGPRVVTLQRRGGLRAGPRRPARPCSPRPPRQHVGYGTGLAATPPPPGPGRPTPSTARPPRRLQRPPAGPSRSMTRLKSHWRRADPLPAAATPPSGPRRPARLRDLGRGGPGRRPCPASRRAVATAPRDRESPTGPSRPSTALRRLARVDARLVAARRPALPPADDHFARRRGPPSPCSTGLRRPRVRPRGPPLEPQDDRDWEPFLGRDDSGPAPRPGLPGRPVLGPAH